MITFRQMGKDISKQSGERLITTDNDLGPAMRALRPRQRAFVNAMFFADRPLPNTDYARMAGYEGEEEYLKVQAYRLAHNENVQAAIREEAERRNTAILPWAQKGLEKLVLDQTHKDHFGALKHAQALGGVSPKNHTIIEHRTDRASLMAEINGALDLLRSLGVAIPDLAPNMIDVTPTEEEF